MVLLSLSIAVGSILILDQSPNRYFLSGQIGGNLGEFFLDWLKIWGTITLLITSYLVLIRGYFNIDFYAPIEQAFMRWDDRKKRIDVEKEISDLDCEKVIDVFKLEYDAKDQALSLIHI